jgi:hypothetical protein
MSLFFASVDWTESLKPYGIAGIFCAFFMLRDLVQSQREAKREEVHDAREAKREDQLTTVAKAVNQLTRAISLEVLTRPKVMQRARDEASAIINDLDK